MLNRNNYDDHKLLPALCAVARGAGAILMDVYNQAASNDNVLGTEIKSDNSPVTIADKRASAFIEAKLHGLTPHIPVVCEENATDLDHKATPAYWAVDPLDGTKEFLGRTGGFAVKIALLRHNIPVLAAVFSPVQDTLYYTATDMLAFKQVGENAARAMYARHAMTKGALTTLFNKTHADPAIYAAKRTELAARGLKIPASPHIIPGLPRNLQVAEGLADLHVVTGKDATLQRSGGFVWDNATDWLLVHNAGGTMSRLTDGKPLQFDNVREKMPGYVTFGDRRLAQKVFPELSQG
ncbi:MAG: 3'(2'),5'-bisphosphate nucleotidase CysQ [Alphaproteobacteria bacterium]|nr:3'(2'),5'-bisphosphate nucleotidase CysQ [Alphaproteobacteria bacterium]